MTPSTVIVQTTPESQPSTPNWMGEVAAFAQLLTQTGILTAIIERVRFARVRMGTYDLIDFIVVLMGYALSGEPTLQAFYERLLPFADAFMALFGRYQLPSRSALSQTEALPAPHRRFERVCAKGHQGRKRGEVVRTRTVVLQAHTHQFLGTFGGSGNGNYRGELLRAIQVLLSYGKQIGIPTQQILIRLDGLYGNAAPLSDVLASGLGVIARHKDYHLLDLAMVQAALAAAPAATCTHPESQTTRTLFDCSSVPLSPAGPQVRLIVATHPATSDPPAVVRTSVFAPAHAVSPTAPSEPATPVIYGPAQWAKRSFTGGFPGSAFTLQPDGTLRCPAAKPLYAQERRPEHDGSLRVLYAGRIGFLRLQALVGQCWHTPVAHQQSNTDQQMSFRNR